MTHDTTIDLATEVPLIRIRRVFDASVENVYRAHVDPVLFVKWIGPHGMGASVDYWDARTGGSWRYVATRGDFEAAFRGCFHELRPSELIIQTSTHEGAPDRVSLERLTLERSGDQETLLTATALFESFGERDALIASGMERGLRESHERLDDLLNLSE